VRDGRHRTLQATPSRLDLPQPSIGQYDGPGLPERAPKARVFGIFSPLERARRRRIFTADAPSTAIHGIL
jgi:hypothetical protein